MSVFEYLNVHCCNVTSWIEKKSFCGCNIVYMPPLPIAGDRMDRS